jgi:photosystem II stability/assembly factor-like uncharacterized protein
MPELDFRGLDEATRAAFKPHFADVVRRAARRRQRGRAGAAAGVSALVIGTSVAILGVSGAARPDAAVAPSPPSRHVEPGQMVVGDLNHLYLVYSDCQGSECTSLLATTADGGTHWTRLPLPVARHSTGTGSAIVLSLSAVAPHTLLLMVYPPRNHQGQRLLSSTDAGVTWHEQRPSTVDTVPPGWRALQDVGFVAADPATGRVVNVRAWPRGLEMFRPVEGLPPTAGLWITGYLHCPPGPRCTGNSVTVSHDGGRSWHRYTFAEDLDSGDSSPGGADIATLDGRTVYAVGAAAGELIVYRTDDGGLTWHRTGARLSVGDRRVYAALDRSGRLLIQVGLQGEHPATYLSDDGGQSLRTAPIGPGALATAVPGGYAYSGWPYTDTAWLSTDGVTWSRVKPPSLG